jgi:hypothetical protein
VLRRIFGPKKGETGWKCITRSFIICTLKKNYQNEQLNKGKMGWTYNMHRREEKRNLHKVLLE